MKYGMFSMPFASAGGDVTGNYHARYPDLWLRSTNSAYSERLDGLSHYTIPGNRSRPTICSLPNGVRQTRADSRGYGVNPSAHARPTLVALRSHISITWSKGRLKFRNRCRWRNRRFPVLRHHYQKVSIARACANCRLMPIKRLWTRGRPVR